VLAASLGILAGTLAIPAATAVASPVSSKTDSSVSSSSTTETGPTEAQWQRINQVSEKYSTFGVFTDDKGTDPVLRLPAGTSAAQKAKVEAALPDNVDLAVKTSRFTEKAMSAISKTVTDRKWNSRAHTYSVSVNYDGTSDKMLVRTDAPLSATKELRARYGNSVTLRQSRFEPQSNRFSGYVSNGGTALIGENGSGCTSGFSVHSRVTYHKYMLTSAHCYGVGSKVWIRTTYGGRGQEFGRVDRRYTSLDTELISPTTNQNYYARIYNGGYESSGSELFVRGAQAVAKGVKVCVSGAISFGHCGHPIQNTALSVCGSGSDVCITDGRAFTFTRGGTNWPYYNNGRVTRPGDSGAPVYTTDTTDSAAFIAGLNHGGIGDVCCDSFQMVAVKWSAIRDTLDLDLNIL
jgi:hypothetical protein